jgi:hypothetical protein
MRFGQSHVHPISRCTIRAMRYRERSPSAILQPFVECIWTLNGAAREVVAQPERILPDGCMELIFHRGKPFRRRGELQPHCFVVGQMIEPAFLQVSTRIEVVGIRFRPGRCLSVPHVSHA